VRIASVGGGPAGLYFALLWKRRHPDAAITVLERNRPDDTFGFGVVFSDATLATLAAADPASERAIRADVAHWDDLHVHVGGRVLRSTGHGFCGLERRALLERLRTACVELGVDVRHEAEVADVEALRASHDLVLGADGVGSGVRRTYEAAFAPSVDLRPNRFVWLGTTFPFPAFTFHFKPTADGLFRTHAYRYADGASTFIVECTDATWRRAGFVEQDEDGTIAALEAIFADELAGHRLIKNRSIWRRFPVVRCGAWRHGNVVLLGDAAHTAHFSIGSGTKLAMEDAIALRDALVARPGDLPGALAAYEAARRPAVEALQRAAQASLEWFETTERHAALPPVPFTFSLMTRSLRVGHAGLAKRDPELVAEVDAWFAARQGVARRPPHQVPLAVGGARLPGRIVARARLEELGAAWLSPEATADGAVAEARATGAPIVVVTARPDPTERHPAPSVALAERLRAELGVVVALDGFGTSDDLDGLLAAGRVDLGVAPLSA
jgi:anthraniloyl-CoA monooxygenase